MATVSGAAVTLTVTMLGADANYPPACGSSAASITFRWAEDGQTANAFGVREEFLSQTLVSRG
jgi:hypothetical protein